MQLPMLAKSIETTSLEPYIKEPSWVIEQKLDGHRLMLCSPGGDFPPTALTRAGTPYTRPLPEALRNFRFPGSGPMETIIDGELVGKEFWAFDLPALYSRVNLSQQSLTTRRTVLLNLLRPSSIKIVPQARLTSEKIALAERAIRENFEGLVLKDQESTYRAGRSGSWLKLKFVTTAECVVTDVRDDGKDSVKLGMFDEHNQLVDVGRASLIGKEKTGTISRGDVIEVRYLYVGAGGHLYQPTIMRKRDDKTLNECRTSQMKYVNKNVMGKL